MLATVRAVILSLTDTPEGSKQAIDGRIQALCKVHSLFVETRWIRAELSAIAMQELAPLQRATERRADRRPTTLLEPNMAQAIAVILA